jgi:hypothetical protein
LDTLGLLCVTIGVTIVEVNLYILKKQNKIHDEEMHIYAHGLVFFNYNIFSVDDVDLTDLVSLINLDLLRA